MFKIKVDAAMIHGSVEPGFEEVRAEFEKNFTERGELGAACTMYHKGEKVVDLWGGYRDEKTLTPWKEDTMVLVFSTTKALSSLAVAVAHSKGLIDYDEKVAAYWPEFAQNGKEDITVRQLLAHQAGLCAIDKPITLEIMSDLDRLSQILAKQKPAWEPGTKQGYHCWNIGFYQNELIRKVDPKHRSLGKFFQEEIASPLGIEFYIGLPKDIPDSRIANIKPFKKIKMLLNPSKMPLKFVLPLMNPWSLASRAMLNPKFANNHNNFNRRDVRSVEFGSGNGIGTARSIAKALSEFAAGGKKLKIREETLKELEKPPQIPKEGATDILLKVELPFSLGFIKPSNGFEFGTNERTYGGFGAGGSCGFADPEAQVGFSYVMNKMDLYIVNDPREKTLREAFYRCLKRL